MAKTTQERIAFLREELTKGGIDKKEIDALMIYYFNYRERKERENPKIND